MSEDPHNITSSWPEVTTIDHVLAQFIPIMMEDIPPEARIVQLRRLLLAREDNIADVLRLAGHQFGAMPGFVAEVIALSGLGTPPSEAEREAIHDGFHRDYEEMRRIIEGGGSPG